MSTPTVHMQDRMTGLLRGLWRPRTLFVRLSLIFVAGLLAAQTLSFWLTMTEQIGRAHV